MIATAARRDPMALIRGRFAGQRKFLQLWTTIALFAITYLLGALAFPGMRQDAQPFMNLFTTTSFLLICAVGETLVIVSGGIDLSVSGIIAFTTTATAALLVDGWSPAAVIPLMLLVGIIFGLVMGIFITYLKVQPFIATLAGMWFARGASYLISDKEIRIHDPVWRALAGTKILIPGLSDPATKSGPYITYLVLVALVVLIVGLYLAHLTRFGRTIYAMGGNNGANEQSSRLMGLPVNRTKVMVYVISGFCSALAGLCYSIYVGSGHGTHASGFELTVIAAVVIGGVALTGGEGYLIGALFGVLITALIQELIQFNGQLSSWWTSIVIGLLMLFFIGVQALLNNISTGGITRLGGVRALARHRPARTRRTAVAFGSAALVVALAVGGLYFTGAIGPGSNATTQQCERKPLRHGAADDLVAGGAVIAYERNGGSTCVDELFAIYPDGRVTGDAGGGKTVTKQVTPEQVTAVLKRIDELGWFTTAMYDTESQQGGTAYTHYTVVYYNGTTKAVGAVDGNTIAPASYWQVAAAIGVLLPDLAGGQ